MKRVPLFFPFCLALVATMCASVFLPAIRLHTFAPFLALLYSRCSRMSSFWIGSLCGLLIDSLGSEVQFGVYALSFSVATLFLYNQKKNYYSDKPLGLSLFTFQISMIITLVLFIFSRLSHSSAPIHLKGVVSDFLWMPFADSVYALVWFSMPMLLYMYFIRINLCSIVSRACLRVIFLKRKKCSD